MQTKLKDYTVQELTRLIEARSELIKDLHAEINLFTAELSARQDPNRPIQLELF
jgi:hypothetical protein